MTTPADIAPTAAVERPLCERFFAACLDMLCVATLDGRFLAVNPAWERVLGWTPDELCSRPYLDFVHPDDLAATHEVAEALLRGEPAHRFVNRYRVKSGGWRDLEWCSIVVAEDGLIYASVRDVAALRRDETRAARIESVSGVGSWDLDLDTGALQWSPVTHALHETEPDELIDVQAALRFYPPDARARLEAALRRLTETGEPYDLELGFVTGKGRRLWVRTTGAVERRGGRIARAYGTFQDVTETRRAEQRLADILDATGAGVWEWNVQTGETVFNERWAEMVGYTLAELGPTTIHTWTALAHPDDLARSNAKLRAHFDGLTDRYACEARMRHRDGRWVWVLDLGQVVSRTADGAPEWMSGTHLDITERKEREARVDAAEREARAARQQLTAAVEALDDGFVLYDADDRLQSANSRYREIYAVSAPAIVKGARFEDIVRFGLAHGQYADALGREEEWLRERLLRHERGDRVLEQTLCDGRVIRVFERNTPDGGRVGLRVDVTELHAARARAEAANIAKSRFLATMSHEIRTPLNGVLGMARVLDGALSDPAHRKMLGVIRDSGELLLQILNDILDFSKIEAGKLSLEAEPFRPTDLARKIEALYTLRAAEKNISFSVMTAAGAEAQRLGDAHRVLQILHNLVGNAMKFTELGEVTVSFSGRPDRPLVIEVRDTGIGMTETALARLFDDFEQADASTTRRFGGTGLGMAIVRRLVALMRGDIRVDSRPGEGTCVRVALPFEQVEEAPAPAPEAAAPKPPLPRRVLVAEDNAINQTVVEAMLKNLGVESVIAADGELAVEAYLAGGFDAVLLDISMPVMDGPAALDTIRRKEAERGLPRTPAIAVTANALRHQVEGYLAGGFDGHVAKPIDPDRLEAALRAVAAAAATPA